MLIDINILCLSAAAEVAERLNDIDDNGEAYAVSIYDDNDYLDLITTFDVDRLVSIRPVTDDLRRYCCSRSETIIVLITGTQYYSTEKWDALRKKWEHALSEKQTRAWSKN
jgi:hypothetical protein